MSSKSITHLGVLGILVDPCNKSIYTSSPPNLFNKVPLVSTDFNTPSRYFSMMRYSAVQFLVAK